MKIFFSFIVAALCGQLCYSQYSPLVVENNAWRIMYNGWGTYVGYQQILGDSAIEDITYKKVYARSTPEEAGYFVGLVREEMNTQKVYYWDGADDHLLYDFDVEVNDALSVWGVGVEHDIVVSGIESVEVDGTMRKKIIFSDSFSTAYWIEGVGSVYGPLDAALGQIVDFYPTLTCFYMDGELKWGNPGNAELCNLVLGISELETNGLLLWPNPVDDQFTINTNHRINGAYTVNIFSAMGHLVYSQKVSKGGMQQMDVSFLSAGVYQISLMQNDDLLATGRMIKK